ncbi:MAG TPA: macro domain-containing protein [Chloroflexia bacterium]|nr:macro domain-containing protein [Chloroflexia bacterium]
MADEIQVGNTTIKLWEGDIVKAGTEAIVNAANEHLSPGGGVCGAIYRAAGYEVLDRLTAPFGGCPTGSAVITGAGRLPAPTRYIIHAVGPVYGSYKEKEANRLLADAYRKSMELAELQNIKSVAFPSISTGIYGFPIQKAAPIAIHTVKQFLKEEKPAIELVQFVLFSPEDYAVYQQLLEKA